MEEGRREELSDGVRERAKTWLSALPEAGVVGTFEVDELSTVVCACCSRRIWVRRRF